MNAATIFSIPLGAAPDYTANIATWQDPSTLKKARRYRMAKESSLPLSERDIGPHTPRKWNAVMSSYGTIVGLIEHGYRTPAPRPGVPLYQLTAQQIVDGITALRGTDIFWVGKVGSGFTYPREGEADLFDCVRVDLVVKERCVYCVGTLVRDFPKVPDSDYWEEWYAFTANPCF